MKCRQFDPSVQHEQQSQLDSYHMKSGVPELLTEVSLEDTEWTSDWLKTLSRSLKEMSLEEWWSDILPDSW
jgi:hypothetical protein